MGRETLLKAGARKQSVSLKMSVSAEGVVPVPGVDPERDFKEFCSCEGNPQSRLEKTGDTPFRLAEEISGLWSRVSNPDPSISRASWTRKDSARGLCRLMAVMTLKRNSRDCWTVES